MPRSADAAAPQDYPEIVITPFFSPEPWPARTFGYADFEAGHHLQNYNAAPAQSAAAPIQADLPRQEEKVSRERGSRQNQKGYYSPFFRKLAVFLPALLPAAVAILETTMKPKFKP